MFWTFCAVLVNYVSELWIRYNFTYLNWYLVYSWSKKVTNLLFVVSFEEEKYISILIQEKYNVSETMN